MQSQTTSIASVKQEVRLQEWTAQIEAQQASGLTVFTAAMHRRLDDAR